MSKNGFNRRDFLKFFSGSSLTALFTRFFPEAYSQSNTMFSASVEGTVKAWRPFSAEPFNLTLSLPADTTVDLPLQAQNPIARAIVRRYRMRNAGEASLMYLDVWQQRGLLMSKWINWYADSRHVDGLPKATEVTVGGMAGVVHVEQHQRDLLTTYFSDGTYVYRLLQILNGRSDALDTYWRVLNTVQFDGQSEQVPMEAPNEAQNVVASANQDARGPDPTCCNHYDANNIFSCCNETGNCTWWCYYKMGYVPFTEGGHFWWYRAPDHSWIRSTTTPSTNRPSIGCYNWYTNPPTGHVCHAASYSGGNVAVTQMYCNSSCGSPATISPSHPSQGWIYPPYL